MFIFGKNDRPDHPSFSYMQRKNRDTTSISIPDVPNISEGLIQDSSG